MSPIKDDRSDQPAISKTRITLLVALSVALAAWRISFFFDHFGGPKGATKLPEDNASYVAFVASAKQAEAISDPLQRCLRYPDLPGSHWNAETTKAYCELRNRRTLSLSQIEALLREGKASEVDRAFQGYLDQQLHDPKTPGLLDGAFYAAQLDEADAHTRKVIDEWKKQSPQSAFALAASGMQYVDAGFKARGVSYWHDVRDDQAADMQNDLSMGRQDLDRAVALLPTITPAYSAMLQAAGFGSDYNYAMEAAIKGLKADPANYSIRAQMMWLAQPKWGSRFGGESVQQAEDQNLVSRNPLMRFLTSEPKFFDASCDCGDDSAVAKKLLPAADMGLDYSDLETLGQEAYNHNAQHLTVELYSEAIRFKPDELDSLEWRAQELRLMGDLDGAVASMKTAANRFPDDNGIGTQLGLVYASAGRVNDSEAAFQAVLKRDPDNLDAMAHLGDLYNHGGHQPDKAEVLADKLISEYPDRPEGYIVRACNQMDHNLPGRYETLHYFIDHYGDQPEWQSQTAEMRAYLKSHPEHAGTT